MGIKEEVNRTYTFTATCDHCGTVVSWQQPKSLDHDDEIERGFTMIDPKRFDRGILWFDKAACVHAYVEANVIEYLRHPEGVR
jgi:hypothetical protein